MKTARGCWRSAAKFPWKRQLLFLEAHGSGSPRVSMHTRLTMGCVQASVVFKPLSELAPGSAGTGVCHYYCSVQFEGSTQAVPYLRRLKTRPEHCSGTILGRDREGAYEALPGLQGAASRAQRHIELSVRWQSATRKGTLTASRAWRWSQGRVQVTCHTVKDMTWDRSQALREQFASSLGPASFHSKWKA